MKTDNLVVGVTGHCKGDIETHNADVWGEFDGDIKASGTLTIQEQGKVSGKIEYQNFVLYHLTLFRRWPHAPFHPKRLGTT